MTMSVRLCIQQCHLQYWALLIEICDHRLCQQVTTTGRLVQQVSRERLQGIKFMLMLIVYRSFL